MLVLLIDVFSIALGLPQTHLIKIQQSTTQNLNWHLFVSYICKMMQLINMFLKLLMTMYKVIAIILFVALLPTTEAACYFQCSSCWYDDNPDYCTSCGGNRDTQGSWLWFVSCPCSWGYYQAGSWACPVCNYRCNGCYNNAVTCYYCKGANRSPAPSCNCQVGYYDAGSPNCLACHYSCNTCSNGGSCSTCNSNYNRYAIAGNSYCSCPARFYDTGSVWCYACHATCLSCSGTASNNCLTCNSAAMRSLSGTSCVCNIGFYATSSTVEQCAACLYSCRTCVTSASTCTTCDANLKRVLSGNTCPCMPGFYQDSSLKCQPCSYQCLTCVTGPSNCLTCGANRMTAPTCACQPYHFDDGSSSACIRCQYTCSSCSSLTKCDTCNPIHQRGFVSTSAFCVCPDRFYDAGVEACASCHPTCFRCNGGASTSCTSCNAAAFRQLSSTSCVCRIGYFQTSSTVQLCSACLYSCLTCSGASTTCTGCSATLNRLLSGSNCPCAPTYFQNSSLLCDTCHSSCATCTSKLSCVTCFSAQLTTLNSSGLCSCADGLWWNTNACSTCNYRCLTCAGSATNCTSCTVNSNRVFSTGSCNCLAGFYDNGGVVCLACRYTCQTCTTGTTTGCTACDSSRRRSLSGGACLCANRFFDDGTNAACQQCHYSCLTCTNPTFCATCSSSLFRTYNAITRLCDCLSNYYEQNNVCFACMATCLTCNNANTCTTCNAALNRFLNTTFFTCDCNVGFFANSSGLCAPCNSLCLTCNNSNTCLTCKTNLNRTLNTATSTCDCQTGFILITATSLCQTCQATCLTCVSNFVNRCATCDSTTGRSLNSTTFQCQCPLTLFFDDGASLNCIPCSYTCLTCSATANSCLSCPAGSNRVYSSASKTCFCAQRFYDANATFTQSATCLACLYPCSTCDRSTSCLTCNSTRFRVMNPVNSRCICMGGYYDDGSNQLCPTCSYTCLTCRNATACLACNSTWNRDTPSARCPCSTGFYDNAVPVCLACHYSCLTCTNGTQCATCQGLHNRLYNSTTKLCSCTAGYYDPGSPICQLCSYSCLTCVTTGSRCLTCNTTAQRTFHAATNSCPCNNGFYDNAALVCLQCNYTCSTCTNNRSCLTCNITRFRTINSLTGLCVCITGYYDDNSTETCLACQATCLTCINSTNCTSCDSNRNRVLNHTANYANVSDYFCPCLYKHYSLGLNNSCSPCHFSCSYCSGAEIKDCLYCNNASNRKLKISGKCICIDGYYDTNATEACPSCNIACLTCWNSLTTTCFTCNTSNFMMVGANTCYVNCPLYYFNNVSAMICTLCQAHCLYCIDSTNCTECEAPMFLYNSTCMDNCPLGQYPNSTTHKCQLCKPGCANCSTSFNCFKCVNTSYYVDQATTLCELCSQLCLTCFGPTQNNCLNCPYPLFLNAQYMCVNLSCSYGRYLDTFKGCQPCRSLFSNSITCNITQVFLCQNRFLLRNGRCVGCNSVQGYALDSYGKCNQICGDGVAIYYQCDDGNNKNGDGCSANCIIEDGWSCTINSQNRSICKLKNMVEISLRRVIKFARRNTLRIILKLSLPLHLSNSNFFVNFTKLNTSQYSYNIMDQDKTDLTEVSIDILYERSIQNQQVTLMYANSRRLQQAHQSQHRLLQTISFSSNFNITAFPPANFINQETYTFYDVAGVIIFYLSIVLMVLNLIIIPKRYALHAVTFSWIVPYLYFTLFYSTSYTTQWVTSIISHLKYIAGYWGFSLGQCCIHDNIQHTTSQVMNNVGGVLLLIIVSWVGFVIISFFNFQIQAEALLKIYRMFKYYLLTIHLYFFIQLTYSATYGIYNYILQNRVDANNVTLALFMLIASAFFVISLWYITCISKFDGSFDEMSSKAATRNTVQKQPSNNTQQNDSNIVINLSNIKESSRNQSKQFNNTFNNTTNMVSSIVLNKNGTRTSGFTVQSRQKTEQSQQQEMGQQQSFFPFDYCYLYNNSNSKSKYFLPILITKLFVYSFFGATLMNYPFGIMVAHLLASTIFCFYLCYVKPFKSKFTMARLIITQFLVMVIQGIFTTYQYFALSYKYIVILEFCIILTIMVLLSLSIIFIIVEQYKISYDHIKRICENCCLPLRLKGKSFKVHDKEQVKQQKIIKVEEVNQQQIGQVDAFYARMLQKQALNKQYKKERMIYDSGPQAFD